MRTVSNTSPISALASIERLSLLKRQFTEVWIPPSVAEELSAHPNEPARETIRAALQEQWLKVAARPSSALLGVLSEELHRGEAEAIALAAGIHADIVLIDEREGRRLALETGLAVTGVLGILLRAKTLRQIPALRPEIHLLRTKANFFVSKEIEAKILLAAGE